MLRIRPEARRPKAKRAPKRRGAARWARFVRLIGAARGFGAGVGAHLALLRLGALVDGGFGRATAGLSVADDRGDPALRPERELGFGR